MSKKNTPSSSSSAKVILIDIETGPNISYTWGKYDQNVIAFKQEWQLLSFAYKELRKQKVFCIARPDFKDPTDLSITKAVWNVLNTADVVIAHNGDHFDVPKMRAKFVEHGLRPTTPFKTIDTKKIAKSQFMFNSNSLNDLAFTLKIGRKKQTGGFDLWLECLKGDPHAWHKMVAYNKHDVILLEKIYLRLCSWYPHHPNLALYADIMGCPVCSSDHVQRRGFNVMKFRKSARFHCQSCGAWFSRATSKNEK